MTPYPHQVRLAKRAYSILSEHMIVYLSMEERTGKTLTAILTLEHSRLNRVLVVTKKQALAGWLETLEAFKPKTGFTVTNYHQVSKFNPEDFDVVILDEAHNYISGFPKKSKLADSVARVTKGKPIIFMSATPYAQGAHLLYHQFFMSSWSPFAKWKTGYSWFRAFGIPDTVYLAGRQVESYKKSRIEEVMMYCEHLFVTTTRDAVGFEHEPEDKVHYVELKQTTKDVYNILRKQKIIEINGTVIDCDTVMKLRTTLHMLEGGVGKKDNNSLIFGNTEKIDYIKQTWGDTSNLVIMYQYIAEGIKLRTHFKHAEILQATSYAEGVDLSDKETLVIYSQDFSTARHSQRRARQANMNRDTSIVVHYLLTKKGISDEVYTTVSLNKKNYIDSLFKGQEL